MRRPEEVLSDILANNAVTEEQIRERESRINDFVRRFIEVYNALYGKYPRLEQVSNKEKLISILQETQQKPEGRFAKALNNAYYRLYEAQLNAGQIEPDVALDEEAAAQPAPQSNAEKLVELSRTLRIKTSGEFSQKVIDRFNNEIPAVFDPSRDDRHLFCTFIQDSSRSALTTGTIEFDQFLENLGQGALLELMGSNFTSESFEQFRNVDIPDNLVAERSPTDPDNQAPVLTEDLVRATIAQWNNELAPQKKREYVKWMHDNSAGATKWKNVLSPHYDNFILNAGANWLRSLGMPEEESKNAINNFNQHLSSAFKNSVGHFSKIYTPYITGVTATENSKKIMFHYKDLKQVINPAGKLVVTCNVELHYFHGNDCVANLGDLGEVKFTFQSETKNEITGFYLQKKDTKCDNPLLHDLISGNNMPTYEMTDPEMDARSARIFYNLIGSLGDSVFKEEVLRDISSKISFVNAELSPVQVEKLISDGFGDKLKGAILSGNFSNFDFRDLDLTGVKFAKDSNLTGADFRGSKLCGVDFRKTNLCGAKFESVTIDVNTDFRDAKINGLQIGSGIKFNFTNNDGKNSVECEFSGEGRIPLIKSAQEYPQSKIAWAKEQANAVRLKLCSLRRESGITLDDLQVLLDTAERCGVPIDARLIKDLKLADATRITHDFFDPATGEKIVPAFSESCVNIVKEFWVQMGKMYERIPRGTNVGSDMSQPAPITWEAENSSKMMLKILAEIHRKSNGEVSRALDRAFLVLKNKPVVNTTQQAPVPAQAQEVVAPQPALLPNQGSYKWNAIDRIVTREKSADDAQDVIVHSSWSIFEHNKDDYYKQLCAGILVSNPTDQAENIVANTIQDAKSKEVTRKTIHIIPEQIYAGQKESATGYNTIWNLRLRVVTQKPGESIETAFNKSQFFDPSDFGISLDSHEKIRQFCVKVMQKQAKDLVKANLEITKESLAASPAVARAKHYHPDEDAEKRLEHVYVCPLKSDDADDKKLLHYRQVLQSLMSEYTARTSGDDASKKKSTYHSGFFSSFGHTAEHKKQAAELILGQLEVNNEINKEFLESLPDGARQAATQGELRKCVEKIIELLPKQPKVPTLSTNVN